MRSFVIIISTKDYNADQINDYEMCETKSVWEDVHLWGIPEENTWTKKASVRDRQKREVTIKIDLRQIQRGIVDWIYLVQCRDQWQSLINNVIRFQFL
jgi:hypothetical protein